MAAASLPGETKASVLRVYAGGKALHLPAACIRAIIRPGTITRVPRTPPSLLGVINLRGAVVPVVSLARLLELPAASPGPECRIVIMQQGTLFGVRVDRVAGLVGQTDAPLALGERLAQEFAGLLQRKAGVHAAAGGQGPAHVPGGEAAGQQADQVLVAFWVSAQAYALRLADVAYVTSLAADTLANAGSERALANLVSINGQLMRLVDLRAVLGLPEPARESARMTVIVARVAGRPVGMVVDRMQAVLRVRPEWVDAVPPLLHVSVADNRIAAVCRMGGGGRLVAILSPESLFGAAVAGAGGDAVHLAAQARPAAGQDAGEADAQRFVVFRLGDDYFGLPLDAVDEVVRRPATITQVPNAPDFVDGVMNLRGAAVLVIGQGARLAAGDPTQSPGWSRDRLGAQRIIMVRMDGRRAGFRVDTVTSILSVAARDVLPLPEMAAGQEPLFDRVASVAHGERTILLINPRTLLNQAARDLLAEFHRAARSLDAA